MFARLLSMSRQSRVFLVASALAIGIVGCTKAPEGITPVSPFDVERYSGTWYEIARLDHRFERGLSNVSAIYSLKSDGKVSVLNKGYDTLACEWDEIEGSATFIGDNTVGSLAVTFFWPFAGGYHVFDLDEEAYGYALVAGPSRKYLWILARDTEISADLLSELVETAKSKGFATDDLILVEHGDPVCAS